MKTQLMAATLVMATAAPAFANTNIADSQSGNGSLFLNVVDLGAGTSYVLDLSAGDSNAGNHAQTFAAIQSQAFTLTGDANWAQFTASVGAADEVQYNVVAFANQVLPVALITSNAPTGTTAGLVGSTNNLQMRNSIIVDQYIHAVNAAPSPSTRSLFATSADFNAYFGTGLQISAGFPLTLADIGTSLNFYNLTASAQNGLGKATVAYTGNWNLTSDGQLTYTPVPLPAPVTLLLSGLALLGILAQPRNSMRCSRSLVKRLWTTTSILGQPHTD